MKLAADAVALRTPARTQLVEVLLERQAAQGERLSGTMVGTMMRNGKLGLRNAYAAVDDLTEARTLQARPLYDEAFEQSVELTPRVKELLKHPMLQRAYAKAKETADLEDLTLGSPRGQPVPPLPDGGAKERLAQQLADAGVAPAAIKAQLAQTAEDALEVLPVRALDYMKQSLDDIIRASQKSDSPIVGKQGRFLMGAVEEILETVDDQVDPYAAARGVWAGHSKAIDAVTLGRDALKKAPEAVKREIAALDPVTRDYYRLGYAQTLYEKINSGSNESADIARRFFGGRLFSDTNMDGRRIHALFNEPAAADDFARMVSAEARISESTARISGRPRSGGGVKAVEETLEGSTPTVRATPGVAIANVARTGLVRAEQAFVEDVSDEIAVLFSKGIDSPQHLNALIDVLEQITNSLGKKASTVSPTAIGAGILSGKGAGAIFN
jgi:hypothetical protein